MSKDKRASVHFDRESQSFVGIDKIVKKQLKEAYKNIDIDAELNKMSLWLNSSKGVNRKGNINFITNWLNNASPTFKQMEIIDSSLDTLLNDYCKDLWKNSEHILEFNTKRK